MGRFCATLAITLMLGLTGCQTASTPSPNTATAPGRWSIGCDLSPRDDLGDRKRQYCWLGINDLSRSGMTVEDTNAWAIKHATIFEIDRTGLLLKRPRKSDVLCARSPRRIAVDGRRIDHLSNSEQVKAIEEGELLVWDQQAEWPACGIAPHGLRLDGLKDALDDLRQRWPVGSSS